MSATTARYTVDPPAAVPSRSTAPAVTDIFLPNLDSLKLGSILDFEEMLPGCDKPFREILSTMLKRRNALGRGIKTLSFVWCDIEGNLVEELTGILPQVERVGDTVQENLDHVDDGDFEEDEGDQWLNGRNYDSDYNDHYPDDPDFDSDIVDNDV